MVLVVCPQHIPGFRGAFALLTVVATFDQVLVYVPLLKREGVTCADLEAERQKRGGGGDHESTLTAIYIVLGKL